MNQKTNHTTFNENASAFGEVCFNIGQEELGLIASDSIGDIARKMSKVSVESPALFDASLTAIHAAVSRATMSAQDKAAILGIIESAAQKYDESQL